MDATAAATATRPQASRRATISSAVVGQGKQHNNGGTKDNQELTPSAAAAAAAAAKLRYSGQEVGDRGTDGWDAEVGPGAEGHLHCGL